MKFANATKNNAFNPFANLFESIFNDSFISGRLTPKISAVNIAETKNYFHKTYRAGVKKEELK